MLWRQTYGHGGGELECVGDRSEGCEDREVGSF